MITAQPLTSFPSGSRVRIETFCGCNRARCRLCAMGLTPGTCVDVESGAPGPLRIKVRGSSLVLGKGLAGQVMVAPIEPIGQGKQGE